MSQTAPPPLSVPGVLAVAELRRAARHPLLPAEARDGLKRLAEWVEYVEQKLCKKVRL